MALAKERTPRNRIVAEDFFQDGTCGFVQLIGSQYPLGVVMFDGEYGYGDGGSLVLECGDGAQGGQDPNSNWGSAAAVKRMWRPSGKWAGPTVEQEWVWSFGSQYDSNSPRHVVFGLDHCSPTAKRFFQQVRWLQYDSPNGVRVTKYQLMGPGAGDGEWVDMPGASWQQTAGAADTTGTVYPHGWNENKRDWHHLRVRYDIVTGAYDGVMIDGDPFGSYTDDPADREAMRAIKAKPLSLPTFENGFNSFISIENKSNTPLNTHGWAHVGYHRLEV
ncbi:hypothetical protein [Patulibacter sp. SYSU D01012]|uniref:hypothetical protein n=1 Tax=Patulibacter sp. SYSU D01012 TaxID=2817381 RepID=UPI001B306A12|nr:hypothetical protein [Patulibacter sp. SYSU D01012]